MRDFFAKKYIFAVCFICCMLGFSAGNIWENTGVFKDIAEKFTEVSIAREIKEWTVWVEKELEENLAGRTCFIEIYGGVQCVLGKQEYGNFSYAKGKDGMLYYASVIQTEDEYFTYAKRVSKAAETAEKKGAKTLFILPPSKIIYGLSALEGNLPLNDKNPAQDEILLAMQQCGVNVVDLREAMIDSGLPAEQLFYKTDHGWTTEAAFLGMSEIVEHIRNYYGDDWDPEGYYCNRANYDSKVYKQSALGSLGRNTGYIYAGYDDFTIIYPRFKTNFEWYNVEKNEKSTGTFEKAFITADQDIGKDAYRTSASRIYLSGVVDRDRIINKDNPDGPRLLCLRDSYFSPVACFLAPMCSQIDMVWARSSQNDLDYEQLILEEDYDYLIIENYPYNLEETAFDYFK